uniref:Uncharacterized protein n=1 Tax=Amphimedon queenslandica TaxID=400682 RepID=A0A1X7TND9_AMPQE
MMSWEVSIASEQKQRTTLIAQLSEMDIHGESVPLSFKTKSGGQELQPAPFALVTDLMSSLFHLLEGKQRLGPLTWHNGLQPPTVVWVKLGGDKSGTSLIASLQIVNSEKPNSIKNSCVFAVFEGPDLSTNIRLALS